MKKSLFFLAFAMIVMASCSKEDDPYNPPVTKEDSISVTVTYAINTTLTPYTEHPSNYIVLETYYNGSFENSFVIKKGVPFVMKGRDFEGNFLGREIAIRMEVVISSGGHGVDASSYSPANPGRIPVTKNMVYTYNPTITFVQWW